METIKEKILPKVSQCEKRISCGKSAIFPQDTVGRFRSEQDELRYCLCQHMKDEHSDFYESIF